MFNPNNYNSNNYNREAQTDFYSNTGVQDTNKIKNFEPQHKVQKPTRGRPLKNPQNPYISKKHRRSMDHTERIGYINSQSFANQMNGKQINFPDSTFSNLLKSNKQLRKALKGAPDLLFNKSYNLLTNYYTNCQKRDTFEPENYQINDIYNAACLYGLKEMEDRIEELAELKEMDKKVVRDLLFTSNLQNVDKMSPFLKKEKLRNLLIRYFKNDCADLYIKHMERAISKGYLIDISKKELFSIYLFPSYKGEKPEDLKKLLIEIEDEPKEVKAKILFKNYIKTNKKQGFIKIPKMPKIYRNNEYVNNEKTSLNLNDSTIHTDLLLLMFSNIKIVPENFYVMRRKLTILRKKFIKNLPEIRVIGDREFNLKQNLNFDEKDLLDLYKNKEKLGRLEDLFDQTFLYLKSLPREYNMIFDFFVKPKDESTSDDIEDRNINENIDKEEFEKDSYVYFRSACYNLFQILHNYLYYRNVFLKDYYYNNRPSSRDLNLDMEEKILFDLMSKNIDVSRILFPQSYVLDRDKFLKFKNSIYESLSKKYYNSKGEFCNFSESDDGSKRRKVDINDIDMDKILNEHNVKFKCMFGSNEGNVLKEQNSIINRIEMNRLQEKHSLNNADDLDLDFKNFMTGLRQNLCDKNFRFRLGVVNKNIEINDRYTNVQKDADPNTNGQVSMDSFSNMSYISINQPENDSFEQKRKEIEFMNRGSSQIHHINDNINHLQPNENIILDERKIQNNLMRPNILDKNFVPRKRVGRPRNINPTLMSQPSFMNNQVKKFFDKDAVMRPQSNIYPKKMEKEEIRDRLLEVNNYVQQEKEIYSFNNFIPEKMEPNPNNNYNINQIHGNQPFETDTIVESYKNHPEIHEIDKYQAFYMNKRSIGEILNFWHSLMTKEKDFEKRNFVLKETLFRFKTLLDDYVMRVTQYDLTILNENALRQILDEFSLQTAGSKDVLITRLEKTRIFIYRMYESLLQT